MNSIVRLDSYISNELDTGWLHYLEAQLHVLGTPVAGIQKDRR